MFLIWCLNCSVVQDKITEKALNNMRLSLRHNSGRKNPHSLYLGFYYIQMFPKFISLRCVLRSQPLFNNSTWMFHGKL